MNQYQKDKLREECSAYLLAEETYYKLQKQVQEEYKKKEDAKKAVESLMLTIYGRKPAVSVIPIGDGYVVVDQTIDDDEEDRYGDRGSKKLRVTIKGGQ